MQSGINVNKYMLQMKIGSFICKQLEEFFIRVRVWLRIRVMAKLGLFLGLGLQLGIGLELDLSLLFGF